MESENAVVSLRSLGKVYQMGDVRVEVLRDVNLEVFSGELVAVCGVSGSGKTTLLNFVSGIDKPSSGVIRVFGEDLTDKDEDYLSDFRSNRIGFVFQSYNLVSTLTVAENIAFPMEWTKTSPREVEERVTELLKTLGIQHRENHFPSQLSGGEQQRVAFARALANNPPLFLADEPTGNLDAVNAQKIVDVLRMLKEKGKTVIVSTHDERIMRLADHVFCLESGRLVRSSV